MVMIPYVLGFMPADSLVIVSLEGPRKRFGPVVRIDLVTGSAAEVGEQVDYLLAFVTAHSFREVIVVAYSDDVRGAGRLVRPLLRRLKGSRIAVAEALRADGERWFSYVCRKSCCPAAGVRYDVMTSKASAQAVVHGLTCADSREALRSIFEPAPPEVVREVQNLVEEVLAELDEGRLDPDEMAGLLEVGSGDDAREIAALLVLAQDSTWGASFMTRMHRIGAEEQFAVWAEVTRRATDDQVAGPGSLAAFAAWLSGDGVLASHAVDRVDSVAPGHPLATLVRSLLDHAVPPSIWDDMDAGEPAATR